MALRIAVPLVVAFLVAGWLLWTRADPARQGGYCTNVTLAVADLLNEPPPARDAGDPSPELAQLVTDAGGIVAQLAARSDQLDVARLQVNTPPAVQDDVDVLVRDQARSGASADRAPSPEADVAFGRILVDYQRRCLYQG
jgi:hypothetical protein